MEAKKFLFKSSNILSVAILLAGLTTFGAGANAQDMHKNTQQTVKMENSLSLELAINKQIKLEQEKGQNIFKLILPKKKVVAFETRSESPPKTKVTTPKPKVVIHKPIHKPSPPPKQQYRKVHVIATAYTNSCTGCTGITSTGVNIKNTIYYNGARVIATDPSIIPTHSLVRVSTSSGESFLAVAEDKGGAIHGGIIDVLVSSYSGAINFGRQTATITILKEGA